MRLLISAALKYLLGVLLVGAMLFLPAGGFDYVGGWMLMGLLFIPMLILGAVLYVKAPALLEKRLNRKEKENTQKAVVAASALIFIAGFTVSGLDHRFGWSDVPYPIVIAASAVLLASYAMYAQVMRENAYLSRTVEVSEGQHIVDKGLYGVVRHPMYAATVLMFTAIPIVLGSCPALLCFLLYIPVIVVRILNEEKLLTSKLDGYADYRSRVRYRLIPFIW